MGCSYQMLKLTFIFLFTGGVYSLLSTHRCRLLAQVVPDRTLPTNSDAILNESSIEISGGTIAGNNIFHSFTTFSVAGNQTVTFRNPASIQNIISRITGDSISNINGVLETTGKANLFLINPNGIIFGPQARLNVGGSFLASTANNIHFNDGRTFSAITPQSSPLLSISQPLGLQFGKAPPGAIVNRGSLEVAPERALALVGGDITFIDGQAIAPSGRIDIGSVEEGAVNLIQNPNGWLLGYDEVQSYKNIELLDHSTILNPSVVDNPQGGIQVRGKSIALDQSQILAQTQGSQAVSDINIYATNALEIGGVTDRFFPFSSWIANVVQTGASGTGGNIAVETPNLSIMDGGRIEALSLGSGAAGNIRVNAENIVIQGAAPPMVNDIEITLNSRISSETFGAGAGGSVTVATEALTLLDGGHIRTIVGPFSEGQGGDLTVLASRFIQASEVNPFLVSAPSSISAITFGFGDGGNVRVSAPDIAVESGAQITSGGARLSFNGSFSAGEGDAGDVNVQANQFLLISGASERAPDFTSSVGSINSGTGTGGDVLISAENLTVERGAGLSSSVFTAAISSGPVPPNVGEGDGGNLTVYVPETLKVFGVSPNPFNPSPSSLGTFTFGAGNAGDTIIHAGKLRLLDGGQINTGTLASGDSGRLVINSVDSVRVSGIASDGLPAQIASNTLVLNEITRQAFFLPPVPTGETGEVTINTGQLSITQGGRIAVQHDGEGNAGMLTVNADSILLDTQGEIIAETPFGEGGNIALNAQDIIRLRRNSLISAEVQETGNGGNISLDTQFLIASPTDNSDIIANASDGNGGNITITAQGILGLTLRPSQTALSDITASSDFGLNGTVDIVNPESDPSDDVVDLPISVVDPSDQINQQCSLKGAGVANNLSTFIYTGRGGLPPDPVATLSPEAVLSNNWILHKEQPQSAKAVVQKDEPQIIASSRKQHQPIEAQGWRRRNDGKVILITPNSQQQVQLAEQRTARCKGT